jgi:hypothetical protein
VPLATGSTAGRVWTAPTTTGPTGGAAANEGALASHVLRGEMP